MGGVLRFKQTDKAIPSPKRISLTIVTTNRFGRKWSNVNINLIRVDDYFYHKPKEVSGVTDERGRSTFKSILEGGYLIQVSTKKVILEELHVLKEDKTIKIKLPSIFGWRRKKMTLNGKLIEEFYEELRTDKEFCFKCKSKYKTGVDVFKCRYCEKYFCSKHKLPEEHNCWGEPKAPPSGLREIITGDEIIARGT